MKKLGRINIPLKDRKIVYAADEQYKRVSEAVEKRYGKLFRRIKD